jgi:radical SAM/Cys-rich protein
VVPGALRAAEESASRFDDVLQAHGVDRLRRDDVTTLQLNVGRRCNQACHHCHVDAGPTRTESMSDEVVVRVLELVRANRGIHTIDITGGAPELHPAFRAMVLAFRVQGRTVVDRCNLTVFFEPGMGDLPEFLAAHRVEIVASLPCYGPQNVDRQRGRGVFDRSIAALRRLNALGYATPGRGLRLHLVYNPLGASLPPPQAELEEEYRSALRRDFGIEFDRLFALTNMPIKRFANMLDRTGAYGRYMSLLVNHFNPATVPGLMCRSLLSVGYDGRLYDCDFNQMLEMPLGAAEAGGPRTVWDVDSVGSLSGRRVATAPHCFGCTAGAGSSCSGALE